MKVKKHIEVKNTNDKKLKFVTRKSLLTFYHFLSMISDFVTVFRIEFKKIMTRNRNKKKLRNTSDAFELNRFRFCDFSSVSTDAVRAVSTADAAGVTIVTDVVEAMGADDAGDAGDAANDAAAAAAASLRERAVNDK